MPLYDQFPYTNFHELNLDWLVQKVASLEAAFPEGTIGISKGGTGADNSTQARENLGIIAPNIPLEDGGNYMMDTAIADLENSINALSDNLKYRIFRLVSDLGLTSGTATLSSCWAAMSTGDILIAPPSEFAPGQVPENAGSLIMVRNAGTSGSLRFYGNRTYEKQFSNNFPSGTWKQILNNTDIIPVIQGGTGATTAEQARQNLGIDFSGTVLSVCNIGADTAGNVPLASTNLVNIYESVVDLGLPTTGTSISAIWNLLPSNSKITFPAEQCSNAPENNNGGYIEICKTATGGYIVYRSKTATPGDYRMYLDDNNAPTGVWTNETVYDSAAITPSSGTLVNDYESSIQKIGKIVILNGTIGNSTIPNNWSSWATFPARFSPPKLISGIAISNSTAIEIRIIGSSIQVRSSNSLSNQTVRFNLTWVLH